MRLYIPTIGDHLQLIEDWTFTLRQEHRNYALAQALEGNAAPGQWVPLGDWPTDPVTLLKGTILKVDRIYIRSSFRQYDSVTFRIMDGPDKRLLSRSRGGTAYDSVRFFVGLSDANNMEMQPCPSKL